MEITYKRSLHKSYMRVPEPEGEAPEHEIAMLTRCHIPNLLPVQISAVDHIRYFDYEISGKQQLSDYLSGRRLDREQLCRILFAIRELCMVLPDYLLREDGICLWEECIYIDLSDESLKFTYFPFETSLFMESFRHWMERLLKLVDHQEPKTVEFAYAVYQGTLQEGISLDCLFQKVMGPNGNGAEIDRTEKSTEAEKHKQQEKENLEETNPIEPACTDWKARLLLIIKEKILEMIPDLGTKGPALKEKMLQYMGKQRSMERWAPREKQGKKKRLQGKKAGKEGLGRGYQPVYMPEQVKEEERQQQHPTVYLGEAIREPAGKLRYQGRCGQVDLIIDQKEFLIGKSGEQVNGVITADGISRLHARIRKEDGSFYIEDLNSTNGTYVNEKLLEYHEVRELHRNDRIRFANEDYVFY